MNSSSVLGKSWVSKNYSEETVNFFKEGKTEGIVIKFLV